MRKHLSYANVAATLALVVAVAGGSVAIAGSVKKAPKNSVASSSIRPNNVTAPDLTRIIRVNGQTTLTDPGPPDGTSVVGTASATCPSGSRVLSGGGSGGPGTTVIVTAPQGEGWVVSAEADGIGTATVQAVAKCLSKKAEKQVPGS